MIAFDDKNLNIDWILNHDELNLSTKDTTQPKLNDFGVDYSNSLTTTCNWFNGSEIKELASNYNYNFFFTKRILPNKQYKCNY